mgnify:CR=1 FL=1
MRVCAVICEYNPFHLGHAYHLRAAREASGADYVLCLMSGALTQRGAFARHDKWLRARAALENGADIVLELPARFACAPAPDFAGGGVALLAALGVVTHLSFGCEPSALPLLSAAASLFKSESPDFSAALQRSLADGLPYPRARALAAEPEVLLMDEPTSALDPISTSKIEELATNLKEQYTIIIVTHNMQQALRISDKTAFFLLGELIEYDDTQKLFYQPKEKRTEDYITGRFG